MAARDLVFLALLLIPAGVVKATPGLLYETESRYQYVQVVERDDGRAC